MLSKTALIITLLGVTALKLKKDISIGDDSQSQVVTLIAL